MDKRLRKIPILNEFTNAGLIVIGLIFLLIILFIIALMMFIFFRK